LEVAAASENIANAAMEISKCLLMDISVPDRLKAALRNANETVVKVRLNEESEMVGQTLGDLELDVETGMWIIAMRRNSEWIYAPNDKTRLRQDDVLIARGHDEGVPILFQRATNKTYTPRKVIDYNEPAEFDRSIDIIVEMKNMCELAVGLAYSALLLNNKDIAYEVQAIEQHLNERKYEVQDLVLEAAASVSEDEDLADYKSLLILASASESISNAAANIAATVVHEIGLHPIITLAVRESDEIIIKIEVAGCSPIVGKTLQELRLETETGIHVLAIKRENRWIYSVDGKIMIQENDVLIARGSRLGEEALIEMCSCPVDL
jgi:uncharacterized protein with PhoU and TrkA domain